MSENLEPHPLDDVDVDAGADARYRSSSNADQPLLRVGIRTVIGSFAVLFLSGVASTNAAPSSTLESISSFLNRASGLVMLAGFLAILVAYRIPHLKNPKRSIQTWPMLVTGYSKLVVANIIGYGLLWLVCSLFASGYSAAPAIIGLALVLIFSGLLVTVAIWHDGYIRAYAIGVLTTIVLMLHSGAGLVMLAYPMARGMAGGNFFTVIIVIGVALFTGLICAGYVKVISINKHAQ